MQSLFQSTFRERNRTTSVSSQQTATSTSSYYSVNNSSIAEFPDVDDNLQLSINNSFSTEELEHVCRSNDLLKLNDLKLYELYELFKPDTIVKLDEGSSGSILKARTKSNRKTYAIKLFKTNRHSNMTMLDKSTLMTHSISSSTTSECSSPSNVALPSSKSPIQTNNFTKFNLNTIHKVKPLDNNNMNGNSLSISHFSNEMNNLNLKSSFANSSTTISTKMNIPISLSFLQPVALNTNTSIDGNTAGNIKNRSTSNESDNNNGLSIRPLYTFDVLNEYLVLNKLKSKYVTPVYGLFKCTQVQQTVSTIDNNSLAEGNNIDINQDDTEKSTKMRIKPITICIVLDFYENSDLLRLMTSIRKRSIKVSSIFKDFIFMQLVQGLKYLHSQNIIHRDIKPENIIIDKFGILKFSDFGYAIDMSRFDDYPISDDNFLYRGTTSFKSPEVVNKKLRNLIKGCSDNVEISRLLKSIDIWSLGVLFYQIKFLNKCWEIASLEDLAFKKYSEMYELKRVNLMKTGFEMLRSLSNLESLTNNLKTLKDDVICAIFKMLNPNCKERWNIMDIYKSEWLVGIRMLVENKDEENELIRVLRMIK